jgi:hypothetical protein
MMTPFAYAVEARQYVFSVRPTLAAALDDARQRYAEPSFIIPVTITAWFADGRSQMVPFKDLCTGEEQAWISGTEAQELQNRLFPL